MRDRSTEWPLQSSQAVCADTPKGMDQRLFGSLTQTGHLHFPKYHQLFLCLLHQILSELPKWNSFTTSRKIHRSTDYRIISVIPMKHVIFSCQNGKKHITVLANITELDISEGKEKELVD